MKPLPLVPVVGVICQPSGYTDVVIVASGTFFLKFRAATFRAYFRLHQTEAVVVELFLPGTRDSIIVGPIGRLTTGESLALDFLEVGLLTPIVSGSIDGT